MNLIYRKLKDKFIREFSTKTPLGVILAGVVGCGKTTLIQESLKVLKEQYRVFEFSGDDIQFRQAVEQNTKYIYQEIRAQTDKPSLIFVDEVQKSEEIFDALKYAFDHLKASFIVSGSNPAYLNTVAKKRLQRRSDFWLLQPFSLPEILLHEKLIVSEHMFLFQEILFEWTHGRDVRLGLDLNAELQTVRDRYLVVGGLPLAHLAASQKSSLIEIRKVVERGFELMSVADERLAENIEVELARLHAQEFSYRGIMNKTGIKKRDLINDVIDDLINHGYLVRKKPLMLDEKRTSYLVSYSYIDPGIVSYLSAETDLEAMKGTRIEGLVHTRLMELMQEEPLKTELFYYKPYVIDSNDKVKYLPGEIDFVFKKGRRLVPLEVKSSDRISQIQVPILKKFIQEHKLPFGIVVYGGLPQWSEDDKILYWPYWLI